MAAHRPSKRFRLRVRNSDEVDRARALRLPLHRVGPEDLACFGFPMTFPPVLVVASSISKAVDTPLGVVVFHAEEAASRPRLEDLVVVMLRIDPLIARGLVLRHAAFLSPAQLLKRILQEDVEEEATLVRLQEFCPGLPPKGEPLPREELHRQDGNAWTEGRL